MPTYDYRCNACDHTWEQYQSMLDKPLRKCPECGKLKAERLIGTGAGVIFKGSGFYETDYRGDSYSKDAKADTANGGKAAGKSSSTKSESTGGSSTSSTGDSGSTSDSSS